MSIETERTYIFRSRDGVRVGWCHSCAAETEMTTVTGASDISGLTELAIYAHVESGAVHFNEDAERRLLICINSLLEKVDR